MTQPDNEKSLQQLFDAWTAGQTLSEQEMFQLKMHPEWSERMHVFQQLDTMAQDADLEISVPSWNRDAGFEQYLAQPGWWQRQGMATVALCFSIFACFIMLFDVKLVQGEQGMQLVWSDAQQQQVLNEQFVELARSNNAQISQRLNEFQQMHKQNTAQMVSYVLENSRSERKEDIEDVVQMIQQQRTDDLDYLKQQFNDINYSIRLATRRNQRLANDVEHSDAELTEE